MRNKIEIIMGDKAEIGDVLVISTNVNGRLIARKADFNLNVYSDKFYRGVAKEKLDSTVAYLNPENGEVTNEKIG